MIPRPRTVHACFTFALQIAAAFLGLAALMSVFAIAALLTRGASPLVAVAGALAALGFAAVAYFASAALASLAYWFLQPLRATALGWGTTCVILAAVVYGAVALLFVLPFQFAGFNLLGFSAVDQAWKGMGIIVAAAALISGPIVALQVQPEP